jgi:hypothetical protein
MIMAFFLVWIGMGLWAGCIARNKGHSGVIWFILTLISGALGLAIVFLMPRPKPVPMVVVLQNQPVVLPNQPAQAVPPEATKPRPITFGGLALVVALLIAVYVVIEAVVHAIQAIF